MESLQISMGIWERWGGRMGIFRSVRWNRCVGRDGVSVFMSLTQLLTSTTTHIEIFCFTHPHLL